MCRVVVVVCCLRLAPLSVPSLANIAGSLGQLRVRTKAAIQEAAVRGCGRCCGSRRLAVLLARSVPVRIGSSALAWWSLWWCPWRISIDSRCVKVCSYGSQRGINKIAVGDCLQPRCQVFYTKNAGKRIRCIGMTKSGQVALCSGNRSAGQPCVCASSSSRKKDGQTMDFRRVS